MLNGAQMTSLYPYTLEKLTFTKDSLTNAAKLYADALVKMATKEEQPIYLRPSILGKPAIDVVARKFFPDWYAVAVSHERYYQVFHDGNVWEVDYLFQLECRGIKVLQTQTEAEWLGVVGNSDAIVEVDGIPVLLELKTANAGYFDSLMRMQNSDNREYRFGSLYRDVSYLAHNFSNFRGHLSQAAFYGNALGIREVVVVVKNKSTSELLLYNLKEKDMVEYSDRNKSIIEAWEVCNCWEDVYFYCGIPQPTLSTAKDRKGQYLIPAKMYGSPVLPLLYEIYEDVKGRKSVIGYRLPSTVLQRLPESILEHYDKIGIYEYELTDELQQKRDIALDLDSGAD